MSATTRRSNSNMSNALPPPINSLQVMAARLFNSFGIKTEVTRRLAVTAALLRAGPDNDDEPEPKPQRRNGGHHLGGGRLV
ncbi:MAG: hypothetical protein WAL40_08540 [Rhodoplanes sp.]